MVRFKVIKGSHLLLGAVIVILVVVLAVIAADFFFDREGHADVQAKLVHNYAIDESEAKTDVVFASLNMGDDTLKFDPQTDEIDIEILSEQPETASVHRPSVLIYHTHTHEAYEQMAENPYVAVEAWRTYDQDYSVVRVGKELSELLRAQGFDVVHDTTDNEQDELSTAYTRSLDMLESHERHFDLYIDLHRDAYIEGVDYAEIRDGDRSMAQLMLLIGNGEGFDVKPFYEENLAFAEELTQRINKIKPGLCREVLVKDGRYNQHIGVFSVLLEVGHNRNTLQEALNALPCFAEALSSMLIDCPDKAIPGLQRGLSEE